MNVLELPDSLLLDIFSFLAFKERGICAQVCQRWHGIANDHSLKKVIRIYDTLSLYQLQKLILYHGTPNLKFLEVRGRAAIMLSSSFLDILKDKCPNLQILHLFSYSIYTLDFDKFPTTLIRLSLLRCFPRRGLSSYSNNNLRCLDLSMVFTLTSPDLLFINLLTSLTCLFLSYCARINDGGLEEIKDILPQLRVLDLEGTSITDRGVTYLLELCTSLRALYIGNNELSNNCILNCGRTTKVQLEELCIENTWIEPSIKDTLVTLRKSPSTLEINNVSHYCCFPAHDLLPFGHRYFHKCCKL